jgi:uncharacterized protein with PQ loop repeat
MTHPFHHQNLRKRSNAKNSRGKQGVFITRFDKIIIVVGVLNAVATVPQVLQIWITQDAGGVSLFSWSYYLFGSIMFLIYGLLHKAIPIVTNYGIAIVLYALIVLGTILYQ